MPISSVSEFIYSEEKTTKLSPKEQNKLANEEHCEQYSKSHVNHFLETNAFLKGPWTIIDQEISSNIDK